MKTAHHLFNKSPGRAGAPGAPHRTIVSQIRWSVAVLAFSLISASAGEIDYTYDAAGRLTAADYGGGKVTTFSYDKNGSLLNHTTALATNADVRITKATPITSASAGFVFTYTLTVTNAGPTAATGVLITDTLPFGILFSSASAGQGSCALSGQTFTCDLGVVAAGGAAVVTLNVFHGITNTAVNTATVTADPFDPNLVNNSSSDITTGLAPGDNDADGIPNWWETLFFGNLFGAVATADPDGDDVNNLNEFMAGTDPTDPASVLRIEELVYVIDTPDEFSVSILTSPMRRYHLQFTEDIANPNFVTVDSADGTGEVLTLSHTPGTSKGMYQVQVQVP